MLPQGETCRRWSSTRPSPKTIRCSLDLPCLLALCLPWMARAPRIMSSWIWHDSTVYIKPQQVSFTNASLSWTTVISDYWHPLHIPLVRTIDACRCMQVRPVPSSTFHVVPYLSYVLNVSMMYPKAALQIRQGLNICRLPLELMASAEPGPQSTPYGRFPSSRWLKRRSCCVSPLLLLLDFRGSWLCETDHLAHESCWLFRTLKCLASQVQALHSVAGWGLFFDNFLHLEMCLHPVENVRSPLPAPKTRACSSGYTDRWV